MLAGKMVKKVEVPHEPGNWWQFRRLSWMELEQARDKKIADSLAATKALGPEFLESLKGARAMVVGAPPAPIESYDVAILLRLSVAAWEGPLYEGEPVDTASIDERTKDWALGVIGALSLPASEEEEKNS